MKALRRLVLLAALVLGDTVATARAQDGGGAPDQSITYQGFSGLFNVITPNTLDPGQVSFGVIHRNYDRELTDIDVNDLAASFGLGIVNRLELGFSYVGNRQVAFRDSGSGAFYNSFPFSRPGIVSGGGDLLLGLKLALAQIEKGGNGFSVFYQVKFPTADIDEGRGTGELDNMVGGTFGLQRGQVGFYGHGAYTIVGDPEGDLPIGQDTRLNLADRVDWGVGLELGSRAPVKAIVELSGELFTREKTRFLVHGVPGVQEESFDVTAGFKIGGAGHSGMTVGGAYTRNLLMNSRRAGDGGSTNPNGFIAELSFTSSERPIAAAPPIEAAQPINHPPSCTLTASPREVFPSSSAKPQKAALAVQASDPDGDPTSVTWSATGGVVSGAGTSASWSAPEKVEEGSFTVTARVSDGKGGEGTCSETIAVKPDPESFAGRVQFEFDRYDLSPEAKAVIELAARHLGRYPHLRLQLEGHTCYIATEEYNLQLGQQRAESIRAQLVSLGIAPGRVTTISYGEARPWQDNAREITRRLNRRGEFRFKFVE
jgi:outer membrane protein OmpA-like peptidoglycan-associated protein